MARRGENIYKRKDGRWEGRYIKFRDKTGRAHYASVYAKSYKEVKEKLNQIKNNFTPYSLSIVETPNIEELCYMWLPEVKQQTKYSTYVKYYNIVNNHIIPFLGNIKISFLETQHIREFVDKKIATGKVNGGGGLSAKTVKDCLSVIKLIIRYAAENGFVCNVNMDCITVKTNDTNIKVLNESQQKTLSRYLIENISYINLGILICLYTGARLGEICALRFEDISMTEKVLYIRKTMQRIQNLEKNCQPKTRVVITSPKSKSSIRDIPLPDFIIKFIDCHFHCTPKAYLLSGSVKNYVEPRTLENKFKTIAKQCGIENVQFHTLRHTFATHSIEMGFETKSLSEILGHSSVNITLNRYVHASMKLKRINMERLTPNISLLPSNLSSL